MKEGVLPSCFDAMPPSLASIQNPAASVIDHTPGVWQADKKQNDNRKNVIPSVISIKSIAEGMALAETWGFVFAQRTAAAKRTNPMWIPPDARRPIDSEDARARGRPIATVRAGKKILPDPSPEIVPEDTAHIVVSRVQKEEFKALGLELPPVGTVIQLAPETAKGLALAVAAETTDARSGDKVAALAGLLGATIGAALHNPGGYREAIKQRRELEAGLE